MKDLKFTLEEIDLFGCEYWMDITDMKLLDMTSMPKLKTLNHSMLLVDYEKLQIILPQLTNKDPWYLKLNRR
jgi:hypothetical protein